MFKNKSNVPLYPECETNKKIAQTENFYKINEWLVFNSLRAEIMFLIALHYIPGT